MVGISTSCKDGRNILNKPQIIKLLSALQCKSDQFKESCDSESQDIDVPDFNEGVKVNEHCSDFLNSWVH